MPDGGDREQRTRRAYVSPLRERQAQETREAILDALTRLLEARGAEEITTRDVAREAGVAERSVYRHFPDRAALVVGLTERLGRFREGGPVVPRHLGDLGPFVVDLMTRLDAHPVEARAEALFNADPRRYSDGTRQHSRQLTALVDASLPELDEHQRCGLAAVLRLLVSSQAWLRLREEFGLAGDTSGPMVAWVLDAIVHEIEGGNPPPSAG